MPLRLENRAKPVKYYLDLEIHDVETFSGVVHIELSGPTTVLQLHAEDLECGVLDTDFNCTPTQAGVTRKDGTKEMRTVEVQVVRDDGAAFHEVGLSFTGTIGDGQAVLSGLYRTSWKDGDGISHPMLTTQCEAKGARRIFPCLDEPDAKAVFTVGRLALPKSIDWGGEPILLLNTQLGVETPPMSTYLFAACAGAWTRVDTGAPNAKIRCWGTPAALVANGMGSGDYAAHVARESLAIYEGLFGHAYPLDKMDMVAVPDFANGAMENWGLITYREQLLYFREGKNTITAKKRICETVAHEVAHQWFGNLVTMQWWDELWLNEAFATWVSHVVCDTMHPGWNIWIDYDVHTMQRAMERDIQASTHAVHMPIERAEDVDDAFDAISYHKGGSVLRMLHLKIGLDTFGKGLRVYIGDHAYGNARGEDLWRAVDVYAPGTSRLMNSWIETPGLPLIAVAADGLSVTRAIAGNAPPKHAGTSDWVLPFACEDVGLPVPRLCPARVTYDGWATWSLVLGNGDIDGPTRATLLQDSVALFKEGRLAVPITDVISLCTHGLSPSPDPTIYRAVWTVTIGIFASMRDTLGYDSAWTQDTLTMLDSVMRTVGMLGEAMPDIEELRGILATAVAVAPKHVSLMADSWTSDLVLRGVHLIKDGTELPSYLQRPALMAVACHKPEFFDFALLASDDTTLRTDAVLACGSIVDPELLARVMRVALLGSPDAEIPEISASIAPYLCLRMPVCSGTALYAFCREHWPAIEARFPEANMVDWVISQAVGSAIKVEGKGVAHKALAEAQVLFSSGVHAAKAKTGLESSVEAARQTLILRERLGDVETEE